MNNVDMARLKRDSRAVMILVGDLYDTKKDELDVITNEYIDKLLKTAGLNRNDFDVKPDEVWALMIGFCYSRKDVKDTKDEKQDEEFDYFGGTC